LRGTIIFAKSSKNVKKTWQIGFLQVQAFSWQLVVADGHLD
jgi:hypothetical protein